MSNRFRAQDDCMCKAYTLMLQSYSRVKRWVCSPVLMLRPTTTAIAGLSPHQ